MNDNFVVVLFHEHNPSLPIFGTLCKVNGSPLPSIEICISSNWLYLLKIGRMDVPKIGSFPPKYAVKITGYYKLPVWLVGDLEPCPYQNFVPFLKSSYVH